MEMGTNNKSNFPISCESCKTSCNKNGDEFRQLLNLSNSGLIVYINNAHGKSQINRKESIILHNVGDKVLKKSDFFSDLYSHIVGRHKTKCYLCNALIQRVCNIVNEVKEIKENEMIAVCEHCKRGNAANKCKRCDEMIKKFLNNEINQYKYRQQALKVRLYEVRRILSFIVDKKNICSHKICQAYYDSNAELKILLELIKSPLPSQRTDIEEYFSLLESNKDSVRENVGNNLLLKCSGLMYDSNVSLNSNISRSESFCICKYLSERKVSSTNSYTFLLPTLEPPQKIDSPKVLEDVTEKFIANKYPPSRNKKTERKHQKKSKEKSGESDKENTPQKIKNVKGQKKADKENIPEKTKRDDGEKKVAASQDLQILKALKDKKSKQDKKTKIKEIRHVIPKIPDLPEIKQVEKAVQVELEPSESIIECDHMESLQPIEMIRGNRIVPFSQHTKLNPDHKPLIFQVKHEFPIDDKTLISNTTSNTTTSTASKKTELKSKSNYSADTKHDGIINYELSNRKFIENGWTKLPSMKIVRKMNIYKMVPANPQFDWFTNHERRNLLTYKSGEKLAEVDENGCGRWFYKNGSVALEYYKTKDIKSGLKCVVYDCDDVVKVKKNKSRKILASFDHLGNGIIYDNIGNVRLKYNQSEGLVIDKKIGPPGRWKWHTLNDPPVLEQVCVETVEEPDPCFKNVVKGQNYDARSAKRVVSEHMLAIEFENFVKAKASKMLQSFKPLEIRMKAVKINDYFAVKVMDQTNIQLFFRCSQVSLKVNMGMLLVSTEIIDTTVSDVSDVATPFDRPISRSKSVTSI